MKSDDLDLGPFEMPYDLEGQCRVLSARSTAARRAAVMRKAKQNPVGTPDGRPGAQRRRHSEDGVYYSPRPAEGTRGSPPIQRAAESSSVADFEGVPI